MRNTVSRKWLCLVYAVLLPASYWRGGIELALVVGASLLLLLIPGPAKRRKRLKFVVRALL